MAERSTESFVSTNVILFFVFSIVGIIMIINDAVPPYFTQGNGVGLLFLALVSVVGPMIYLSIGNRPHANIDQQRFWCAVVVWAVLLVGLTARQLAIRQPGQKPVGIHDGAVQSEVAAKFLLQGKNPYGADYRGTLYAQVNPPIVGGPAINVVWSHYIYPPLTFLLFVPLQIAFSAIGPLADYRLLSLGALVGVFLVLLPLASSWTKRTRLLLLTVGNPLLWIFALAGSNEQIMVLGLIGATTLLFHRRAGWAGFVFGLAMASKQTAWLLLPLGVFVVWKYYQGQPRATQAYRQLARGLFVSLALTFGPFIVWNPSHVYIDLVQYASGLIPFSYPISGTTFLQYLHIFHLVASPWAIIPTYIFQLVVGIPVLIMTVNWFRTRPVMSRWLAGAAMLVLAVLLFSRYLNNNYLVVPVTLLVAAMAWQWEEERDNLTHE